MKYNDFASFYLSLNGKDNDANTKWKEMNEKYKAANRTGNIVMTIVNLPIIFVIMVCILHYRLQFQSLMVCLPLAMAMLMINFFIALMANSSLGNNGVSQFNKEYKYNVINKLLENFVDELDYVPLKGISRKIYDETEYKDEYNEFESDDYFEGKIGTKKVVMADVDAKLITTEKDDEGNTHTETTTIFNGLFGKVFMDKSIDADISITRGKTYSFGKMQKVDMDFREFEQSFTVVSDNNVIAMQILTIDLQEDILELYNNAKLDFDIIIKNNNMYVFFETGDMFEVYSTRYSPKEVLEKYFEIMKFITKIVEKISKAIGDTQI
ncbi:MAG: DUF3137 domain-containing protein [Clostridia bacterium]|nr:DUF3137 domain-containing protein [Clostridia bacterium]